MRSHLLFLACWIAHVPAWGADYYWDIANGGGLNPGNGTWSTSDKFWNDSSAISGGGGSNFVWNNGGHNAFFYASGTSAVTVSGTVNVNSITFNGTGYTVGGTALTMIGSGGNITVASGVSGTINAPIAGSVGLTKLGSGTLVLGGSNSYTGSTLVSAGTLLVNGSTPSGSTVTVSNAATLGGTGTIGGATTIQADGIHAAGNNGIGTQIFSSSLTYNDSSVFAWNVNGGLTQTRGTGYDAVNVAGGLTDGGSAGGAVFSIVLGGGSFSDAFWNSNHTWTDIFTTNGTTAVSNWANIFTSFGGSVAANGLVSGQGQFSLSGNTLTWNAVIPEPGSALAGLLLAAGMLRRRRTGALPAGLA